MFISIIIIKKEYMVLVLISVSGNYNNPGFENILIMDNYE